MTLLVWPCVGALVYCCCITHGPQLWLEATLTVIVAGYGCWLTRH